MRQRRLAHAQNHLQVVRELGVPCPFSMKEFRLRLARYSGRPVNLEPAEFDSGSPSGIWFRKKGADYLFYESRTSPYYQAYVVLHLTAHAVLADLRGAVLDPGLVPAVNTELARLMLGDVSPSPVSDAEADGFAFAALCSARRFDTGFKTTRSLRRLEPLRRALLGAVPQAARASGQTAQPGATRRLHQAVIEIREAALALRPYRDPEIAVAASSAGRGAGLAGSELAVAVEAAVLAEAIQARQSGQATAGKPESPGDLFALRADLASEVAWLEKVSRAFRRVTCDCDCAGTASGRLDRSGDSPFG